MTHPALACLTLAEIRDRGHQARRMGPPYLGSNPFVGDDSIEPLEEWAARCMAWNAGWLEEDRGRNLEVLRRLRAELPWLAAKGLLPSPASRSAGQVFCASLMRAGLYAAATTKVWRKRSPASSARCALSTIWLSSAVPPVGFLRSAARS